MINVPGSPGTVRVETRKVHSQLGRGVPRLETPKGKRSPGHLGEPRRPSHVQGCSGPRRPSPRAASSSRPSLGREDHGRDPAHKAVPVIGALESRCLRGLWTRLRREASTCGGRAWQPPREQPVLGGGPGGAGRAERGNSVREGRPGCTQAGPPPGRRKASPPRAQSGPRRLSLGAS